MAKLTPDEVKKVALLAKLDLTPTEIKKYTTELAPVIDYVSQLADTDTSKVKEMANIPKSGNVLREDKIDTADVLTQGKALSGTDRIRNGYFITPRLLENK